MAILRRTLNLPCILYETCHTVHATNKNSVNSLVFCTCRTTTRTYVAVQSKLYQSSSHPSVAHGDGTSAVSRRHRRQRCHASVTRVCQHRNSPSVVVRRSLAAHAQAWSAGQSKLTRHHTAAVAAASVGRRPRLLPQSHHRHNAVDSAACEPQCAARHMARREEASTRHARSAPTSRPTTHSSISDSTRRRRELAISRASTATRIAPSRRLSHSARASCWRDDARATARAAAAHRRRCRRRTRRASCRAASARASAHCAAAEAPPAHRRTHRRSARLRIASRVRSRRLPRSLTDCIARGLLKERDAGSRRDAAEAAALAVLGAEGAAAAVADRTGEWHARGMPRPSVGEDDGGGDGRKAPSHRLAEVRPHASRRRRMKWAAAHSSRPRRAARESTWHRHVARTRRAAPSQASSGARESVDTRAWRRCQSISSDRACCSLATAVRRCACCSLRVARRHLSTADQSGRRCALQPSPESS